MSIQAWEEERQRIRVEEALLQIEAEKKAGIVRYTSMEKVFSEIDRIIDEVEDTSL
ncbi:MAG: hypothetical protein FWC60_10255 [Firmicutes bacterium]|nr:hypothetical protein [Bacillota bacterium]